MNLHSVDAVVADLDELISLLVGLPQGPRSHPVHVEQLEAAMGVVARFYVQSVTPPPENSSAGTLVHLGAVCRGAANSEWASATPAGSIQMTIRNGAASDQFVQGKEYEVLFREVEIPKVGDGHAVQAFRPDYSTHLICGVCGFYPAAGTKPNGADATPEDLDWSKHDEHFTGTTPGS